jgi:outer membrane protein OmpA-like peptidoglycan-associated protein
MIGRGRARSSRARLGLLGAPLLLAAWLGGLVPLGGGRALADETRSAAREAPLELRVDPQDVDLAGGRLLARMSRPAAKLTLKLLALSGAVLAEVEQTFDATPAGTPLEIRWTPPAEAVARLELFGHARDGYYKGIAITPWSFEIPHEDVVFRTDSSDIDPSEVKKLEATLALIRQELSKARRLGAVTLFILAHTDSVGADDYNLKLSLRRALSIARWFKSHGAQLPMAYDGMGERMLKVKTADETPEARNRRVDYMLGLEPPRFERSKVAPAWKKL